MSRGGDVRQVIGVPVAGDFANSTGTPLVIDAAAGTGGTLYYMDTAGAVQAISGGGGGGGGAPTNASYITLALNGALTAERVLTAGAGIAFVDTGANGTLTISSTVAPFAVTTAAVSIPYPAVRTATINVADAAITATSKILVSLAGAAPSAENDADSIDLLGLSAFAKAGSMDVRFDFLTPQAGAISINYAVAA